MTEDCRDGIDQKKNPVKAIREKCKDCTNGSTSEIDNCTVTKCQLYPFRFGKNPYREKREFTEAQKAVMAKRLEYARSKSSLATSAEI